MSQIDNAWGDEPGQEKVVLPPAEKPGRGCLFYGCLIAVILAVLTLIGVVAGGIGMYRWAMNAIAPYVEPTPRELPIVTLPPEEEKALEERWNTFEQNVKEDRPAEPLVLDSEQINALLQTDEDIRGHFYVEIVGDSIHAQVSLPLEQFGLPALKGQYLNGDAEIKASLEDGVPIVTMQELRVKGKSIPEEFMKGLRGQNLAKDAMNDPDNARLIRKFERIEVKDGKIYLIPKKTPESENAATTPPVSVDDRVIEIVSEQMGKPKDTIKRTTSFVDDLDVDDQDTAELVKAFEEAFDITIPVEDAGKLNTVGQVIDYIETHGKPPEAPAEPEAPAPAAEPEEPAPAAEPESPAGTAPKAA